GARFAVTPCICRQERQLAGEGCGKPLETCLSLDGAADGAIRQGRGRAITLEEALHILQSANCAGLVLQPGNSKDAQYFCCCCGDCCGVLRNVKRHPQPGRLISSAFYAVSAAALCSGCGECLERCQMDAISLAEGWAAVDRERCIGCGLCVTTCPSGALRLERKPAAELPHDDVPAAGAGARRARSERNRPHRPAVGHRPPARKVRGRLGNWLKTKRNGVSTVPFL
ncbi:MAG: hypothetical protein B6D39_13020, partial [Anaerolineae bacterium UTCFX2]